MSRATDEQLDALHAALANDLASRLKDGEKVVVKNADGEAQEVRVPCSAATLGQIRQFLKDNHIEVAPGKGAKRFGSILDNLPFAGSEDDADPTRAH